MRDALDKHREGHKKKHSVKRRQRQRERVRDVERRRYKNLKVHLTEKGLEVLDIDVAAVSIPFRIVEQLVVDDQSSSTVNLKTI